MVFGDTRLPVGRDSRRNHHHAKNSFRFRLINCASSAGGKQDVERC